MPKNKTKRFVAAREKRNRRKLPAWKFVKLFLPNTTRTHCSMYVCMHACIMNELIYKYAAPSSPAASDRNHPTRNHHHDQAICFPSPGVFHSSCSIIPGSVEMALWLLWLKRCAYSIKQRLLFMSCLIIKLAPILDSDIGCIRVSFGRYRHT